MDPPCKYVLPEGGGCGGCKLQALAYSAQLQVKQQQVSIGGPRGTVKTETDSVGACLVAAGRHASRSDSRLWHWSEAGGERGEGAGLGEPNDGGGGAEVWGWRRGAARHCAGSAREDAAFQ